MSHSILHSCHLLVLILFKQPFLSKHFSFTFWYKCYVSLIDKVLQKIYIVAIVLHQIHSEILSSSQNLATNPHIRIRWRLETKNSLTSTALWTDSHLWNRNTTYYSLKLSFVVLCVVFPISQFLPLFKSVSLRLFLSHQDDICYNYFSC